jgi:peptide/nickel transport system ATP-binding protein
MNQREPVIEVKDLRTYFRLDEGLLKAVDGVSFTIHKNRTLGVVGESGCGKSVTAQAILRIVPSPGSVQGEILFYRDLPGANGSADIIDLAALDASGPQMRDIRGREIAMIFQEPMTAFSPVHTIGFQMMEAVLVHEKVAKEPVRQHAIEMLRRVGIANPERRVDEYPYQLSGGMRQRAMIAMALMLKPKLLIADEPTTALDVTIQAQILRLIKELQAEMGMAVMFITHNLGVIANMAEEVAVMYLGRVVEYGAIDQIFGSPRHPYTQALMRSIPKVGRKSRVRLQAIAGTVPVPLNPPQECGFASRCTQFIAGRCDIRVPALIAVEPNHQVRCVLYDQR